MDKKRERERREKNLRGGNRNDQIGVHVQTAEVSEQILSGKTNTNAQGCYAVGVGRMGENLPVLANLKE
jgi:urease accessory protein UreF